MNKSLNKGVILVNTYSRANSLKKCLESIETSNENFGYPVVIVHQEGFSEVALTLNDFSSTIDKIIRVNGDDKSPLENINTNRYLGYQICFNEFAADWVLAIEEDVEIAKDAIRFCSEMTWKYSGNIFFRGINLGSREKFEESISTTYSRQRYGLHGQAAVITRGTWKGISQRRIWRKFSTHGFDSLIEFQLKTGFMITPNNSRSLDTGWDGTHLPANQNDAYFVEIAESFVGFHEIDISEYTEKGMQHNWRSDIELYKFHKTPFFIVNTQWNNLKHKIKFALANSH